MKYKVEKILIMEGNSRNLYDSVCQDRFTPVTCLSNYFEKIFPASCLTHKETNQLPHKNKQNKKKKLSRIFVGGSLS